MEDQDKGEASTDNNGDSKVNDLAPSVLAAILILSSPGSAIGTIQDNTSAAVGESAEAVKNDASETFATIFSDEELLEADVAAFYESNGGFLLAAGAGADCCSSRDCRPTGSGSGTSTTTNYPSSRKKNAPCFVATVAFGTDSCMELSTLRAFRDGWLIRHKLGRSFTKYYYQHGPVWAGWLTKHPAAKAVVRALLAIVVKVLRRAGFAQ